MASRVSELLDRFLYRPDEAAGALLDFAPEVEAVEVPGAEAPAEHLAFLLEGETYAVPIAAVREILKVGDVTEVPRAPRFLLGLVNVRGDMLPLYDVKVRLRLAGAVPVVRGPGDVPRGARVVLLRDEAGDAGVLVDGVAGVVKLLPSRVEPAPGLGGERHAIAGLCRHDGQLYILLDVAAVLA